MMDLSDGLSTDLPRMCAASGCGASIEDIPIDRAAHAVATALGADPAAYALDGGEDFELLVAIERRAFPYLAKRFAQRFGRPLLRVGSFNAEGTVTVQRGEVREPLRSAGWDHLRA